MLATGVGDAALARVRLRAAGGGMNRGLLNALTLASLLLWLACAAASVRARWATDEIVLARPIADARGRAASRVFTVENQVRAVSAELRIASVAPPPGLRHRRWLRTSADDEFAAPADLRLPGVRYFAGAAGTGGTLYVAHWLVSVVALPLPALVLFRWVARSKRRSSGMCAACGYDLRHNPERCPECGTPTGAASPAA